MILYFLPIFTVVAVAAGVVIGWECRREFDIRSAYLAEIEKATTSRHAEE